MKGFVTAVATALLLPCLVLASRSNLAESTESVQSPDRGFYIWLDSLEGATEAEASYVRSEGYTMAYARVRLDDYRETEVLPSDLLEGIQTGFAAVRAAGIKVIIRCVYNYPGGGDDYREAQDASLLITLRHIAQLGPIFSENQDAIAYIQGGFIGAWGEQHTSSNGNDDPGPLLEIRNALVAAFPRGRAIAWRYPPAVMLWGLGRRQKKHALHNDCFMSSPTDVGTYSSNAAERAIERAFAATTSRFTPYGGETCSAGGGRRLTCDDILREGKQFHVAYLNALFDTTFHNQWMAEGCFDEVEMRLGYRLWVESAIAPARATQGSRIRLSVLIKNAGWSIVHNSRPMNIVLTQGETQFNLLLRGPGGIRGIPSNNSGMRRFNAFWRVPRGVSGEFLVHLNSPDPSTVLKDRPEYNLRFANAEDLGRGVKWVDEAGMMALGLTVTIS